MGTSVASAAPGFIPQPQLGAALGAPGPRPPLQEVGREEKHPKNGCAQQRDPQRLRVLLPPSAAAAPDARPSLITSAASPASHPSLPPVPVTELGLPCLTSAPSSPTQSPTGDPVLAGFGWGDTAPFSLHLPAEVSHPAPRTSTPS